MAIGDKWEITDPKAIEALRLLHDQAVTLTARLGAAIQRVDAADKRYTAAIRELLPDLPPGRRFQAEIRKDVLVLHDVGKEEV